MNRELGELARRWEVEEVIDGLRAVRLQIKLVGLGKLGSGQRQCPVGQLHQHGQLLPAGGRVRHHDLSAIHHVDEELFGNELVEFLAVLIAEAVAVAVVVLADQDRQLATLASRRLHFLVEGNDLAGSLEAHGPLVELHFVLARIERQVEHGESKHHLREVLGGTWEVARHEAVVTVMLGVVAPERVDVHQVGQLLLDRQLVVVVLGPFHRGIESAEQLPRDSLAAIGLEEAVV